MDWVPHDLSLFDTRRAVKFVFDYVPGVRAEPQGLSGQEADKRVDSIYHAFWRRYYPAVSGYEKPEPYQHHMGGDTGLRGKYF